MAVGLCAAFAAQGVGAERAADLAELSLEELAELPVISVSKRPEPVASAAASIYVLTEREIRRFGASTLPEAMRLAPNLQVARVDARSYAITARGQNSVFANKLLVLVDGRSVYSPLFSGVLWDAQDVVLEDLDRIEVVSGPGGTLWGANAVNGVVNIVSRSAAHTQGALVSVGAGEYEQQVAARLGGSLTNRAHYRVYAKHHQHDDTFSADGRANSTGWRRNQTGFRMDWQGGVDALTLQGDAYSGSLRKEGSADIEIGGANMLVRAARAYSPRSNLSMQAYVDHTLRDQPTVFRQQLTTFDVELQHEWRANERHQLVWGGGYRHMIDRNDNAGAVAFLPENQSMHWQNIFLQDEIKLFDDIRLTLGSKLEYNPFTRWEVLPSAQLAWSPSSQQLVWGALSRVVRSPSRLNWDHSASADPQVIDEPQFTHVRGPHFVSEVANVLELGYRGEYEARLSYSITGYYGQYDRLRTVAPIDDTQRVTSDGAHGDAYGVELWASWQPTAHWRLHGGAVVQRLQVESERTGQEFSSNATLTSADPSHFWQLRSSYDVSHELSVHATLRYVDELAGAQVPAYTQLDANITWWLAPRLQLSLAAVNLLNNNHAEFGGGAQRSVYGRSLYGKLAWGL